MPPGRGTSLVPSLEISSVYNEILQDFKKSYKNVRKCFFMLYAITEADTELGMNYLNVATIHSFIPRSVYLRAECPGAGSSCTSSGG